METRFNVLYFLPFFDVCIIRCRNYALPCVILVGYCTPLTWHRLAVLTF